jgi:hypothetical protein
VASSELDLPPGQVPPRDYDALARWARSVDDIEARELRVRLGR